MPVSAVGQFVKAAVKLAVEHDLVAEGAGNASGSDDGEQRRRGGHRAPLSAGALQALSAFVLSAECATLDAGAWKLTWAPTGVHASTQCLCVVSTCHCHVQLL